MVEKLYELTCPQKSIWNMEGFFEDTTINNICASITIPEKLNEQALIQSVYNIVEKNDSFRIRLISDNNKPMQYISEFRHFEIEVINIKNDSDFNEIKEKLIDYKFNIINSDLFCFKIAKFPDGHGMLIFTVHHIIADSWSLGIFARRIMQEYFSIVNNKQMTQEFNYSYIDFIKSEENYLNSSKYEKDKAYWAENFKKIPEAATFSGNSENLNNNYDSKRNSFGINFDISRKIQEYCAKNRISVFNFFMSIYSIYLFRTTGFSEFVVRNSNIKSWKFQ